MFEQFMKEWGAWSVSLLSLGVAALALVNSRRAVRVAEQEHAWKATDRVAKAAAEALEAASVTWSETMRDRLDGAPMVPVIVPSDKRAWADQGNGKYYRLIRLPAGIHMVSLHAKLASTTQVIEPSE